MASDKEKQASPHMSDVTLHRSLSSIITGRLIGGLADQSVDKGGTQHGPKAGISFVALSIVIKRKRFQGSLWNGKSSLLSSSSDFQDYLN